MKSCVLLVEFDPPTHCGLPAEWERPYCQKHWDTHMEKVRHGKSVRPEIMESLTRDVYFAITSRSLPK